MTVNAVLFDLDGTLLDSAPAFLAALDQYCDQVGRPHITAHRQHYASAGARAAVAEIYNITHDHPEFEARRADFLDIFLKTPVSLNSWYPGITQLLQSLTDQGMPWGIVTNKPRPHTEAVLSELLPQLPAALICQGDLPTIKPAPEMLLAAAEQLKIPANRCLYAGDHLRDVQAAQAARMRSLGCTYGYLHADEDPTHWQADDLAHTSHELTQKAMQWLTLTPNPN